MVKEFFHKSIRNMSPMVLAEAVKHTISRKVRYVHCDEFEFEEYHRTFDPKDVPDDKAVLIEWTRFPKHYKKDVAISLTYLLVCPEEYIEQTERALYLAGFKASDVPFQ